MTPPLRKPQLCRNDSHLGFLEPPHTHDPSSVSNIASLPVSLMHTLPSNVQTALQDLQESTSIAFASYTRLQDLLDDKFDRLLPSTDIEGVMTFSESSFFNFTNCLSAERSYFLNDALPDWRHKASLTRAALQPYNDCLITSDATCRQTTTNIFEWWGCLQAAVSSWSDDATAIELPDYEDTIDEYLAMHQRSDPTLAESDDSLTETPDQVPTPLLEDGPKSLHLSAFKTNEFVVSVNQIEVDPEEYVNTMLRISTTPGQLADTIMGQEFLLKNEGTLREERKDSGIDMAN